MIRIDLAHRFVMERQEAWRDAARRDRDARRAGEAASPKERELRRVGRVYYLVTALSWFAAVLPMAVSVLFAQARGFSLFEIGLCTGVYALSVALLEVPTGGLADTIGRKRVALLSSVLALVASGVFLFAFSLPVLLAHALVHGASRALGSGALQAWFVDTLQGIDPEVDLQPRLALAGTFELLALAAGTLLGGSLPTAFAALPAHGPSVLTPLATPVLASLAMHGVVIVTVALLVREARGAAGEEGPDPTAGLRLVLRDAYDLARGNPVLLLLLGAEALGGFALMGMEVFWQPFFAERLGAVQEGSWLFGVILAGCFGAGMVGNLAAVPVTRRSGRRYGAVAAGFKLLQAGGLLALAHQQAAIPAVAFFWLAYFAMGSANSPLATLVHLEVPAHRRSVMLSVQSLAGFAGSFAGSLALGWVAYEASIAAGWTIAAGLLASSALLLVEAGRRRGEDGRAGSSPLDVTPGGRAPGAR